MTIFQAFSGQLKPDDTLAHYSRKFAFPFGLYRVALYLTYSNFRPRYYIKQTNEAPIHTIYNTHAIPRI